MKLYIGLLVLGLVIVAGGLWFVFTHPNAGVLKIKVTPAPGSCLINSQNISSQVLLKDIQININISDKEYSTSSHPVNVGESIMIVSGTIQNKHNENNEIDMWAEGYDETGKQVAWTLDAAHISGHIGLHLENEEIGQFTLHLNMADNIKSICIFANNYPVIPP